MARSRKSPEEQTAVYSAPAVEKALDILELLASQRDGATAVEVCRLLGRSMGEVYRVLLALEGRQYIAKEADTERYHLTLRLFDLAHRHPPTAQLVRLAQPIMERVAAQTMQSCHLAVADGAFAVVLASVDSPMPMRYGVKVGAKFPLLETSSGFVVAAFGSPRVIREATGPGGDNDLDNYAERIARIRKLGHEVWDSQVVRGVTNVSAPVLDHSGHACAALTIPYLEQSRADPSRKEALESVVAAAAQLSRELGYNSGLPVPDTWLREVIE